MLRRLYGLVGLIVALIGGYLMGTIVGLVFIIPFILIRHTNETEQNWLLLAAGSIGTLMAWFKWRAANAGLEDPGDVHGSARWASARESASAGLGSQTRSPIQCATQGRNLRD